MRLFYHIYVCLFGPKGRANVPDGRNVGPDGEVGGKSHRGGSKNYEIILTNWDRDRNRKRKEYGLRRRKDSALLDKIIKDEYDNRG